MRPTAFAPPPVLTLGAIAAFLIAATLVLDLVDSRRTELDYAIRQIEQHDRMLAEHVARSFDSIEVLLDEMRLTLQDNGRWQHWSSAAGHQYLKERLTRSLPQIRHLIIFDAGGNQRHTSFAEAPPPINVADRPYFRQLADGAERARYGPYIGRNSNRPTYAVARRLTQGRDRFAGALMIAIEPEYFEQFCHTTRPYEEFEAAIVNGEGRIIAFCRSLASAANRPAGGAGTDFRQVLAGGEFSGRAIPGKRSVVTGDGFVLASEPVPGYADLRVVSSTPKDILVQGWRKHALRTLGLSLLGLAALLGAALLIRRQFRQLSALAGELRKSHETLEARVHEATHELQIRRAEAERLAESKSRFFAAASHDLRQPLHALQLFLGDLARLAETPEQKVLVQRIDTATRAMTSQLRSLLDISRLDMANIVPERVALEIAALFEQLATTYQPSAETAGVRLLFRPRAATVDTDPALLARLLGNLIDNAIKFSPGGRVLVCARWRANAVRIEVRDNGRGIPRDQQQAIYDEFYQIGNSARDPGAGLGLGLAIAHRIARLLGANLSLRSDTGAGTSFAVTLPSRSGTRQAPAAPPAEPRLVLIGEPGDFAARARRWGYGIAIADTVAAAWRLLDGGQGIPVIVCGAACRLPADALALLRQHPGVVISPADCDMPDLGAYHLREPVKPARLRALLRSLH
ncbi:ATP-binding protein [Azospira restricta]|uniref:histidine kinase n=1 Tax=Azospira restricta TaxID=404405 RepID=A0A974SP93_9RHOO|nr:ATP-binding protein [Azospira restricta]QRJ63899.1 hypothetical protein IWH25_00620 [Azospira restricta]